MGVEALYRAMLRRGVFTMLQPGNVPPWDQDSREPSDGRPVDASVSLGVCANMIAGSIVSIHHGLTRTGIRVRVGGNMTLRVRWPSEPGQEYRVQVGQRIVANIGVEAVLLGAPGIWPGAERWNRWTGRIVLVEPGMSAPMITVKAHGEPLTLKSTGPVLGLVRSPQVWNTVNIVVDPEKVRLVDQLQETDSRKSHWASANAQTLAQARVWVKGSVQAVRRAPTGWLLSLEIGGAHVSALVSAEKEIPWSWMPGEEVEVNVSQWEAWLKPSGRDVEPVRCSLFYPSTELADKIRH